MFDLIKPANVIDGGLRGVSIISKWLKCFFVVNVCGYGCMMTFALLRTLPSLVGRCCGILCLALALSHPVWSASQTPQEASTSITRFDNWKVTLGSSNIEVTAIIEDEQGFFWLGTSSGLARFNGQTSICWTIILRIP